MRLLSLLRWVRPQSAPVPGLLAIALVGFWVSPAGGQQPNPAPAHLPIPPGEQFPLLSRGEEPDAAAENAAAENAAAENAAAENAAEDIDLAEDIEAKDIEAKDVEIDAPPASRASAQRPAHSPPVASEAAAGEFQPVAAEAEVPPAAPPLSLERPLEDPLLPGKLNANQRLTPLEQERLRLGLERKDREAEALYRQGATGEAYVQFFRGLALRQHLTLEEEIPALGNVGERAWRDGSAEAVQTITARLLGIAAGLKNAAAVPSQAQRLQLAQAYGQVRALDEAIAQYEALLAEAADFRAMATPASPEGAPENPGQPTDSQPWSIRRPGQLSRPTRQWIEVLARLNLARLNYSEAARYTELALALAQLAPPAAALDIPAPAALRPSPPSSPSPSPSPAAGSATSLGSVEPLASPRQLLAQLAYIYEQDRRYAEAAAVHQQRWEDHAAPLDLPLRPGLSLAIARNQDLAGQLVEAIASYQETYRQAQLQQQFAISHEALALLAQLYRSQGQLDDALAVYDILRQVEELSYDLYGLMENQADQAEIHLRLERRSQALQAYRQALHLARLLGYREAEFAAKLVQLQQGVEPPALMLELAPEEPPVDSAPLN